MAPVQDRTPVVLGFDGSFSGDTTAIVGVTIEDTPRVWLVDLWEKQPGDRDDWRVDIGGVEARILETCGRLNVVEVACDPYRWQRSMEALAEAGVPITEYPSSSPARMVPATAKFFDAVVSGEVSHDHSPALARHLANCVIKTDQKGPRVVKEHRGSPRKIDAAVAALIAFDRATHRREAEPEAPVAGFFSV
jgi:phage terminase large subunit-like protein